MKNILHIELSGNPGGIVTLTRDIQKNSSDNNIFFFAYDGGIITDQIINNGGKCYFGKKTKNFLKVLNQLKNIIINNNIDIVINHTVAPIILIAVLLLIKKFKKSSIKFFQYEHSNLKDGLYKKKLKNIITVMLLKKVVFSSNYVIAISNYVKEECEILYGKKLNNHVVIYNGVDTKAFNNIAKYKDHFLGEKLRLIYIGRLIPEKGVQVLIEAIKYCIEQGYDINLKIVGDGEYKDYLVELTNKFNLSNFISFIDKTTNIKPFLGDSDVFIHPAIWNEGFGITIAEAMSAGLPCIAFCKGAIMELIDDNETGFLCKNVSAKELAATIEDAFNFLKKDNAYELISKNAQKKAATFDINRTISMLEKLF